MIINSESVCYFTVIRPQLLVAQWFEVIGDSILADDILDRMGHSAYRIGEWEDCCLVRIHGQEYGWFGKFLRWLDWTEGCIALTNDEIDEVYKAIENGTKIEINP